MNKNILNSEKETTTATTTRNQSPNEYFSDKFLMNNKVSDKRIVSYTLINVLL